MTLFGGWRHREGLLPHVVDVFEHGKRELVLYLRWRPGKLIAGRWQSGGAWKYRSLKVTLAQLVERELATLPPGRARKPSDEARARLAAERWAIEQAQAQYNRNRGTVVDAPTDPKPAVPTPAVTPKLTLRRGWEIATNPEEGRFSGKSAHETAVAHAMAVAIKTWGAETTWEELTPAHWTRFLRRRFAAVRAGKRGAPGLQTALHDASYVMSVAAWLREHQHLPAHVALPPVKWKKKAKADFAARHGDGALPKVKRPRHTADEFRRLLIAARTGEPRLGLVLALGAELRAGQVLRGTRADLVLPPIDWTAPVPPLGADDPTDYGQFTVQGRGLKLAPVVDLTRGQRLEVERALTVGYLRRLEAAYQAGEIPDYPLFPGRELVGAAKGDPVATMPMHTRKPLSTRRARVLFHALEEAAGITPVPGRAFYGARRRTVDEATTGLGVSPGALMQLGGWTDEATPRGIYKDVEDARDRRAAREARAKIRGESAPQPAPKPVNNASTPPRRRADGRGRRAATDHTTRG